MVVRILALIAADATKRQLIGSIEKGVVPGRQVPRLAWSAVVREVSLSMKVVSELLLIVAPLTLNY